MDIVIQTMEFSLCHEEEKFSGFDWLSIVWKIYKIEEIKRAILLLNRDEMLEIFERKNKGNYTFIKMEKKNRKCDSLDCSSQSFLYQVFTRNYFSSPRNDVSIPGENNKLSLSSPLE